MADIKEVADHRWTADPNLAAELPVPSGVAKNPMTTAGDMIIGGTGGVEVRLPAGTSGQVLNIDSVSGLPAWINDTDAGFAVPAIGLGTAAAAGVAATVIRSDATIVAFDATAPVTQNYSDIAATGSATVAARRDHVHGMPASSTVSFPLTSAGNETFQPNGVANNALTITNVASSVNGLTVTGSITGSTPKLQAAGSDTNISLLVTGKAHNDSVVLGGAGGGVGTAALTVSGVAGFGINGVTITQAVTAAAPSIAATGSDANVSLTVAPQGTGSINFTGGAAASPGTALTVSGVSSGINGLTVSNGATGGPPKIAATGGDTNIGMILAGKGSGKLSTQAVYASGTDQTGSRNITGGSNTNSTQRRRVYVVANLTGAATGTVELTYTTTVGGTTLTAAHGPKITSVTATENLQFSFAVDPGASYSVNTVTTGSGTSAALVQWIEVDE